MGSRRLDEDGYPLPLPAIVTLEQAKLFVRVDHEEDDTLISMMIAAATEAVLDVAEDYDWVEAQDEGYTSPARIRMAILAHVANAYDGRTEGVDMPASAVRLVGPFRTLDI